MKVFAFTGSSGAGKTTLIEKLIAHFLAQGLRVSSIKHAREGIEFDHAGKDSQRHRRAGSGEVLLVSGNRWMLQHETADAAPLTLAQQLDLLAPCDLVLVEGYKASRVPRLGVFRSSNRKPFPFHELDDLCAVASDVALDVPCPVFDLDDIDAIATFVLARVKLHAAQAPLRLVASRR